MLVAPQERAAYILRHVWKDYDSIDSTMYHDEDKSEQFLVNYFEIARVAGYDAFSEVSDEYFEKADAYSDSVMLAMADKYFSPASSPMFSDSLYITVMESANRAGILTDARKVMLLDRVRLSKLNAPGDQAPDFSFITQDGKEHRLSELRGKHIVLTIYNIGCEHCESVLEFLKEQPDYNRWTSNGDLHMLAVTSNEDKKLWKEDAKEHIPSYMLSGLDVKRRILLDELFDVRAYPTLYLLDQDMRVIAKDISIDDLTLLLREKVLRNR